MGATVTARPAFEGLASATLILAIPAPRPVLLLVPWHPERAPAGLHRPEVRSMARQTLVAISWLRRPHLAPDRHRWTRRRLCSAGGSRALAAESRRRCTISTPPPEPESGGLEPAPSPRLPRPGGSGAGSRGRRSGGMARRVAPRPPVRRRASGTRLDERRGHGRAGRQTEARRGRPAASQATGYSSTVPPAARNFSLISSVHIWRVVRTLVRDGRCQGCVPGQPTRPED